MPPKKETSKKTVQKKKQQAIEDKTFGLKNKNKSKKVQEQIQSIKKAIDNSGDPRQRKLDEQRKLMKAAAKAAKKAAEEEQNALFSEGLLAVKKTSVTTKAINDAKGRDHDEGKEKATTSRAMKMMFQMDAKEMEEELMRNPNYVRTIEDDVELQRQQKLEELRASGIAGTPVTAESFAAWKERKRKLKQEAAKKLVEAEFRKKKGGKGLSVLSGRDLFEYKRDLFKDDDDAEGVIEREPLLEEERTDIIQAIADQVQTDLFLDGDDEDLDELLEDSDDEDDDDSLEEDEDEDDTDEDEYPSEESIQNLPN